MDLNWLISVDDHILEPPDVWQSRVAAKYKDRAPKIIHDHEGEAWLYDGVRIPTIGLTAVAGKKYEEFSPLPVTYDEMRPGCYDSVERLKDMDQAGILASLCFPSLPRFCGQIFSEMSDRELGFACLQAYNDFIIDQWCGSAPGRFIPMTVIPLWDPALAIEEMRRCADKGAKAIAFSESPFYLGFPSLYDPSRYWDPVFAFAQEAGLPLCMHTGSSSRKNKTTPDASLMSLIAFAPTFESFSTLCDWIFTGTLNRFPTLKICLSEGGIGWIPPALERFNQVWEKQRHWAQKVDMVADVEKGWEAVTLRDVDEMLDLDGRRPLDTFRDQIYGCFIEDYIGVSTMKSIGAVDNMMIETDYPHSDSSWPDSIKVAHKQVAELTDEEKWKVLQGNARKVFNFEPAEPPSPEA